MRILLLFVLGLGLAAFSWGLGVVDVDSQLLYTLAGIGATGLSLLSGGVWVACLALVIVVIVRARDKLRNGAIVLLVALVLPSFFALDVTGDVGAQANTVLYIIGLGLDLLALIISAVGAYFLLRGYRSATQQEGSRYAMF